MCTYVGVRVRMSTCVRITEFFLEMTSNVDTTQLCGDIQEQAVEKRDCSEEANDEGEEHDQGGHSLSSGYFQVKFDWKNDLPGDDGTLRSVLLLVLLLDLFLSFPIIIICSGMSGVRKQSEWLVATTPEVAFLN